MDTSRNHRLLLCSFCAQISEELFDISQNHVQNNKTPAEMLKVFRGDIEFFSSDQLTNRICLLCLNQLKICDEFYHKIQTAQIQLKEITNQNRQSQKQHKITKNTSSKSLPVLLPKPTTTATTINNNDCNIPSGIQKSSPSAKRLYKCFECQADFNSIRKLNQHIEAEHFNNMICKLCNTFYKDYMTFRHHKRKDHKTTKCVCRECSLQFTTQRRLFKHFKAVHEYPIGVFYCSECDFMKWSGRENLINHLHEKHPNWTDNQFEYLELEKDLIMESEKAELRLDDQDDPVMDVEFLEDLVLNQDDNSFQFNDCFEALGLSFEETFDMKNEMIFDTISSTADNNIPLKEDNHYNCPRCPHEFPSQTKMFIHLAHVHHEEVLVCNECGSKFNQIEEFRTHRAVHLKDNLLCNNRDEHVDEPILLKIKENTFYECKHCHRKYKNKSNYFVHACSVKRNATVPASDATAIIHKCSLCNLVCASSKELNLHHKNEHLNKSLQCTLCDKVLHTLQGFKYHLKTHEGNKPLICPYCSRRFLANVNLKAHIKAVHAMKKSHLCTLCDRRFATLDHLKKHVMSVHQKERNHFCNVCGRCFSQVSHLKQHLEIHNPRRRLQCESCSNSFTRRIDLRKHFDKEHGDIKQ